MSAPLVTLTLWGVPPRCVPAAFLRMGLSRRAVRRSPGLRFAKLLGTGDGTTFTVRDADPLHWGLLAVWDDTAAADAFETGPVHRSWARIARERLDIRLDPISSRGTWAGYEPFGPNRMDDVRPVGNAPVAAITRARLRPSRALSFWRAVPPVSAELNSLWNSTRELGEFAYRRPAHADVIRRTGPERWYAEELFARFRVLSVRGTFNGVPVPGWTGHLGTDGASS